MKKRFLEKIRSVTITHQTDHTPMLFVYETDKLSVKLPLTFEVELFNIQPNTDYTLSLRYTTSEDELTSHIISNTTVNLPEKRLGELENGYGHSVGSFNIPILIEEYSDYELTIELYKTSNGIGKLLDSYTTYFTVEKTHE